MSDPIRAIRIVGRLAGCAAGAVLLAGLAAPGCQAQTPPAPTSYSVSEIFSAYVDGEILQIGRDGQKATVEQEIAPQGADIRGSHSRAYYDLAAGKSYTLDLIDPSKPCGPSSISGDWGDPFAVSADLAAEMAKYRAADVGTDSISGIMTKILDATTPQGEVRVWIEPATGLVMKWEVDAPHGPPKVMLLVTAFSITPPPPEDLAPPAKCAG